MKLSEFLQFAIAIITIVAMVFRIADIKNKIDNDFKIFVTQYNERKEFVDYLIHGLDDKINHKFQRVLSQIESNNQFFKKEVQKLQDEIKNLKK